MAAPLLAADGQVLGVVTLDRDQPAAYGPDDLRLLGRLAEEASAVMRRLWELGHLRGKARQLEALITAGQSLVAQLAPPGILRHPDPGRAPDAAAPGPAPSTSSRPPPRSCASPPIAAPRARLRRGATCRSTPASCRPRSDTRRPVAFADIRSPEFLALADLPRDPGLASVLAAPVAYEGEVLGVLAVFLGRASTGSTMSRSACAPRWRASAPSRLQNARLYARVFASEESLRKNERLTTLGLLSAEIAHEIRNPLTVLKLLHGGLGADLPEGDPRRTDLRVIGEKLDQLEAIVDPGAQFRQGPVEPAGPAAASGRSSRTRSSSCGSSSPRAKIQLRYAPPDAAARRRRGTRASSSRCCSTC